MSSVLHRGVSSMALVVATYSRFSTDLQRDASTGDQSRLCREAIARQGWHTGPAYEDRALSGSSANRPGYQALLDGVRERLFQILVTESLDRLSRDQEDPAAFFKLCKFYKVGIHTLAEGWITELHVGLKGTMSALFLKELADKTRRGLWGRVEAGGSAAGLTYGYAVVAVPEGEDRGARAVNPKQATVVARIFREYAHGMSPRAVAAALNREGVPGPRGEGWSAEHHRRKPQARHRPPQQRTLRRRSGLERRCAPTGARSSWPTLNPRCWTPSASV